MATEVTVRLRFDSGPVDLTEEALAFLVSDIEQAFDVAAEVIDVEEGV